MTTQNFIGTAPGDVIILRNNYLVRGKGAANPADCGQILEFLRRANASGATFCFNPQFDYLRLPNWPEQNILDLIQNTTVNLTCGTSNCP